MTYFLMMFPMIFATILCFAVGNIIPALIVGSLCFATGIVSFFIGLGVKKDKVGTRILLIITFPLFINCFIIGIGAGIYYIAR